MTCPKCGRDCAAFIGRNPKTGRKVYRCAMCSHVFEA